MKHKTFRGKWVDMESLRRKHNNTVAGGNMGVNANGDKLGPGGTIVETAQKRTKRHYTTTSTSKSTMSVKGDKVDTKEPIQGLDKPEPKAAPEPVTEAPKKKAPAKRKKAKPVEVETDEGDIIIEEPVEFPEEFDEEDEA